MLYRMYYKEHGRHTHVTVRAGKGTGSLGSCGNIVMTNEEWKFFRDGIERTIGTEKGIGHYIEFLEET